MYLTFYYNNCTYCLVQYLVGSFCILRNVATSQCYRCVWSTFQQICPHYILNQ